MTQPIDALERREAWEIVADVVADAIPETGGPPEEFGVDPVLIERLRSELHDPTSLRERADAMIAALERRGFILARADR